MAFRRRTNEQDSWNEYRDAEDTRYEELGIPIDILATEQRFIDFLTSGVDRDTGFELEQLDRRKFFKLFQLVTSRFDMQAATFTACEKLRAT